MRNVAVVAVGTAGAQTVNIAFTPVITRCYGPEALGLLETFMALVGALYPICALAYPIAIILPREDGEAKGIIRISLYVSSAIALFFMVVLLVDGDQILGMLKVGSIANFSLLIPLSLLFATWLEISQKWLTRKKQFKIQAKVAVLQSLIFNGAKVTIGWFLPTAAVLIVLTAFSNALQSLMLWLGTRTRSSAKADTEQTQKPIRLLPLAKRYYDFPAYRAPQAFMNAISQMLPVLMLTAFFGPTSAGFFGICRRVLNLPSLLIGKSVAQVFYPRITEAAQNDTNVSHLIIKATFALIAVGVIPFSMVVAFGPWLFGFVFGNKWTPAGEYARWLALGLFFAFINRPSVTSIPVLKLQGYFLAFEIVSIVLRILVLLIGFYIFADDIVGIMMFSLVNTLLNIFLILWTLYHSKRYKLRLRAGW